MNELQHLRVGQITSGELWDELKVNHMWIHLVRGLVNDGEIARVGVAAFGVYIAIKAHTDLNTGKAFPSIDRLAELTGLDERTVRKAVRTLEGAGLLKTSKQGRSNSYEVVEKIQLVTQAGEPWGTGERKYVATGHHDFIDELKRLARTGNFPGDKNITINVTVQNITQGENGTVNVQNVQVSTDEELRRVLGKK